MSHDLGFTDHKALGRKPRALRVERASEKASLDKVVTKKTNRPLTDKTG